jgi:hypothetical protein
VGQRPLCLGDFDKVAAPLVVEPPLPDLLVADGSDPVRCRAVGLIGHFTHDPGGPSIVSSTTVSASCPRILTSAKCLDRPAVFDADGSIKAKDWQALTGYSARYHYEDFL